MLSIQWQPDLETRLARLGFKFNFSTVAVSDNAIAGFDEFSNSARALFDLAQQRFQIQSRFQPAESISMACGGKLRGEFLQPCRIESSANESRSKFPRVGDLMRFEPRRMERTC